jgi:15-cis-phytoene synthase
VTAGHDLDAARIHDPALRTGYLRCRALHAAHSRQTFRVALLLPPGKRPYVHALYGFARHARDMAAEPFEHWSEDVLTDLDWGATSDPISRALIDTVARWNIPHGYFADFLAAVRSDRTVTEYPTFDDLTGHLWGTAGVISLQLLPIIGRRDVGVRWDELETPAVELGFAFRLSTLLRDVGRDVRRGRVYLPLESLAQFAVDRDRLARGRVDEPIRNLLAWEIERTRVLYRSAEAVIPLAAGTSQRSLRAALRSSEGILDEIERRDYDVFTLAGRAAPR